MGKIWATIDRFEEDKAVLILPDNQQLIVDRANLPGGLKEGDSLKTVFVLDKKETSKLKAKNKKMINKFLNKSK